MQKKTMNNKKPMYEDTKVSKKTAIEVNGKVLDVLPGGKYRVELENKHTELSEYDLTQGRITYRK